ncbi:EF-hand calcium-binding domain-containing protein 5, partial [Protobothrops mucrosquamatus]|uniref:EF-hand calcium-binding domain-containing protein 5 n=1 Tax=Protobothrops mucrosquamatus TaxID=103944 RepID=UPI0010FBA5DB
IYARPLETLATLDVKVNQEEFVQYLLSYVKNFTSDLFQELLKHLLQSSHDARNAIRHDVWRQMFVQLFFDCEYGQIGLLDRAKVLSLLEKFYRSSSDLAKEIYCNPKKWPIAELDDIDLTEFWGNLEPDDEEEPPEEPPTPERTLSQEAIYLNRKLKGILSDEQAALGANGEPAVHELEDAEMEQQVSPPEAATEDVPTTAAQDEAEEPQAEMPASELEPQVAEAEEEPEATTEPTTEEVERPAGEEAAPEDHPGTPLEPLLEGEEVVKEVKSEEAILASPSQVAARVQKILDDEEEPVPKSPSVEKDLAPKGMEAEGTDGQEEPEEKAEPGTEVEEEEAGGQAKPEEKAEADGQGPVGPKDQAATGKDKAPGVLDTTLLLLLSCSALGPAGCRSTELQDVFLFPDLRLGMIEIQTRGPPASLSPFEKSSLNLPQFVQLMETFVGEGTSLPRLKKAVEFLKKGYLQTEAERFSQLEKVHQASLLLRQQLLVTALFEKWDNECSGFLEMKEVDSVLSTFKEGMEEEALTRAKLQLPFPTWHPSGMVKLTQRDFQSYVELVMSELTGTEQETLDNLVEFLMMAVGRPHLERLRGNARRKWLLRIEHAAVTGGGCMEPIYQAVFKALSRDTDAHGDKKKVSAYIALLEYNVIAPERGDILLRYVASTEDDAPYLLNQILFMDMPGVSFQAALDDRPIHVPRVHLHGNIHFWNSDCPQSEQRGSFLVLPLEDVRRRVFGVLGLDTLRDKNEKTIFVPHEIRYYQGIAHYFSKAYHHIRTQQSLLQIILTGVEWLCGRAPGLQSITAYFMEPGESRSESPSKKVRDYLFKCIDCALVVTQRINGEQHVAVPLRNTSGQAIMMLDLNLGARQQLSPCAHKDMQKMLKMVQAATHEILKEDSGDLEPYYVLEAEYVGDWRRGGVLFYRFMLQDLQHCMWNLDPWTSFGDIRSLEKPPALVHIILKCVVLILYPQWAGTEEVEKWSTCIQKLDGELIENICYFDPTASYVEVRPEVLYSCLKGARRKAVWRFGSAPLEYLYNWTCTCLSLIEMSKKLQHHSSMGSSASALWTPTLSQSIRSSQISSLRSASVL